MLDKLAGLPTQIRQLEKRLKEMDASKVKPALVKEITDTINNLKNMLKEKQEKREQRKKDKEQKAAETSKEEVTVEADAITDKVEKDPKIAPAIITPDSLKEKEKIVEKVEKSPEIAPHLVSEQKPKFKIDDKVEPIRGGTGSWGHVMREADVNGDPLVYVKWMDGALKEKHGEYGGYYTHDLKLKAEEQPKPEHCPCWEDKSVYCPECKSQKTSDLKSNYEEMLKDLKSEHQEALDKHDHVWVVRLEQKIAELEAKMKELFNNEKEAGENGSGGTEQLTVVDHTPAQADSVAGAGGKDGNSEYQDMWANPDGRDLDAATGAPGSLFTVATAPAVVERLKSEINAPYVQAYASTLGGDQNVAIMLTVGADPKETWTNGILENSRYGKFTISNNGTVEQHSGGFNRIDTPKTNVRKRTVKSVDQLIQTLNQHLAKINTTSEKTAAQFSTHGNGKGLNDLYILPSSPEEADKIINFLKQSDRSFQWSVANVKGHDWYGKRFIEVPFGESLQSQIEGLSVQASFKIASIPVTVFKHAWTAEPTNKESKLSYIVMDESGKKVLSISPLNGKQMDANHLKYAIERELTHGFKQAKLTENIAFLKAGSKVLILAEDKNKKRVKFADLSEGIRGWAPASKFKVLAAANETMKHGDHVDEVLGHREHEKLVDCPQGSGNVKWVALNELLPTTPPPATPESLNLEETKKAPHTEECNKANDRHVGPTELCICDKKEAKADFPGGQCAGCGKDLPLVWGTTVCKECVDKGFRPEKKEALKTALPPTISDQDAYLNNPVQRTARGCDQCNASMINGVFCHETGCPNQHKEWEQEQEFGNFLEGSLNKQARVVHQKDGWHVLSEKGKNLGGPYGSKEEAVKRLRQVEYFKHHGAQRPFSKKAAWPSCSVEGCNNKADSVGVDDGKRYCYTHSWGHKQKMKEAVREGSHKKAEVLTDPYQSLTEHITDMRSRMSQVQEKIQSNPVPKTAGENEQDNSNIDLPELFEDLSMGIDLLETKLKDSSDGEELHKSLEELENLLWEVEMKAGIKPEIPEHEKAEPEHKEIVEDIEKSAKMVDWKCPKCGNTGSASSIYDEKICMKDGCGTKMEKEAALPVAITPTLSAPAQPATTPAAPAATPTPDDAKPTCALCGGMTFNDFAQYQQHMEFTHASNTMPTSPTQKLEPTDVTSKKKADIETVTDDIITNDPTAVSPPVAPNAPVIQNVQPTDNDNLEIAVVQPTSPPAPGQKWVFDTENNVYVSMPDPAHPNKTI